MSEDVQACEWFVLALALWLSLLQAGLMFVLGLAWIVCRPRRSRQ